MQLCAVRFERRRWNTSVIFIPKCKYFILIIFAFYIDYSHPHANVCVYRVDHKNETVSYVIIT